MNALAPATGFGRADSLLTLTVPAPLAARAVAAGGLEIVDPEGVPLAVLDLEGSYTHGPDRVDLTGTIRPLPGVISRPFGSCYRSPEHACIDANALVVPVIAPLTVDDVAAVRERTDGRAVVFLVFAGTGTPVGVSAHGLIRATLAAAAGQAGSVVVAVPVAARDNPSDDRAFRDGVVNAYAQGRDVLWPTGAGHRSAAVRSVMDHDRPTGDKQGLVVFFTGLSGSGKSTIAQALRNHVLEQGIRTVSLLDGDRVRRNLSAGLTFSPEDRETNIARIGWVAAEISRHGGMAICSPIAPYDRTRRLARSMVEEAGGAFILIHVATPLAECERRDRKGLYARARRGEIDDFTGISAPYEVPSDADLRIDTTGRGIDDVVADVIGFLGAHARLA